MGVGEPLQKIADHCEKFSEYSVPSFSFRTTIPKDEIIFTRKIAMGLMWLNGQPLLNVLDTETIFQNAIFIKGKTAGGL